MIKEVDELILLDISATVEQKKPQLKIIAEVASECFMPLCYGGVIWSLDEIREIFSLGVEKVTSKYLCGGKSTFYQGSSKDLWQPKYCRCHRC